MTITFYSFAVGNAGIPTAKSKKQLGVLKQPGAGICQPWLGIGFSTHVHFYNCLYIFHKWLFHKSEGSPPQPAGLWLQLKGKKSLINLIALSGNLLASGGWANGVPRMIQTTIILLFLRMNRMYLKTVCCLFKWCMSAAVLLSAAVWAVGFGWVPELAKGGRIILQ